MNHIPSTIGFKMLHLYHYVKIRENVDSRWVVPYNPWLLNKYDCHINVKICINIKCVKYLYKYIH